MPNQHIKMPAVLPRVQYTANGIDNEFEYPFPIFASEDIRILFDGVTQTQGFVIEGAGDTNGGNVIFDSAPISGTVIIILRQIPYERYTDFLESGDFSADALNDELDYLTASIQQIHRDQQSMLRFDESENPAQTSLPSLHNRANKALGFDGQGNPIVVDYGLTQAPTNFTATGIGAVNRSVTDKVSDMVSIRDFGAIGDGVTDDTNAIAQALLAHDFIYIPSGTYRVTNTIDVGFGKRIMGAGQSSVIKADTNLFDVLSLRSGYCVLSDFKIINGKHALHLQGQDTPCVQNRISNMVIENVEFGIVLDGGADTNKPCYWNTFRNCLILSPNDTGIRLTKTGAGDTPNANIFDGIRVYSNGASITNDGIRIDHGSFYNRFLNCEINVDGTAQSCFTVGAGANETVIDNLYCESTNGVPNVVLQSGSQKTLIQNLLAMSNGAAIDDQSGGAYQSLNAGYPTPNKFGVAQVDDFTATLLRQDTVFIEASSTANIALNQERSMHLVSANQGEITIDLPLPSALPAATFTIKKIDFTGNAVKISEPNGLGIDRKSEIILGGPYDYVTIISNGAEWFITSSNRMAGNTKYFETSGTLDIDMSVDVYLISSYIGAVTCRLPPANAAKAIGRTITIKKTDVSGNPVYISEQGGNGPDQFTQPLNSRYSAITVVSNGAEWYIVSKF
jgi:hypothetical protein